MDVMTKAKDKFNSAIEHFESDLKKLRTGRPTPDMFEQIQVEAYGSMSNLGSVGNINVVDATLVTVQVWDKTLQSAVVNALQNSDYGYNPQVNEDLIRVPIPAMTEEKRIEVVKSLKEMTEKYRIEVRVIRKDLISELDEQKKANLLTEDQYESEKKGVQTLVDSTNEKIEELTKQKEAALLTL